MSAVFSGLFEIPAVDEVAQASLEPEEGVGECLRFADQVGDTLTQSIVGTFNNRGLAEDVLVALDAATVLERGVLEEGLVHVQAIGEDEPPVPRSRHLLPHLLGALQVAPAHMKGHHLEAAA